MTVIVVAGVHLNLVHTVRLHGNALYEYPIILSLLLLLCSLVLLGLLVSIASVSSLMSSDLKEGNQIGTENMLAI